MGSHASLNHSIYEIYVLINMFGDIDIGLLSELSRNANLIFYYFIFLVMGSEPKGA